MNPDRTLDAIAESMQAIGTEGLLAESLQEQIDVVVQGLLSQYRGDTLTNEKLWAGIGAIDQMDKMQSRFTRAIRTGQKLSEQLTENSNG